MAMPFLPRPEGWTEEDEKQAQWAAIISCLIIAIVVLLFAVCTMIVVLNLTK